MNQEQMKSRLAECTAQLKMALRFAEEMSNGPVKVENISTLWTLSGKAHSSINGLKSESGGNQPPKMG